MFNKKTIGFTIREATNEDIPLIKKVVFTVLPEYGLQPHENKKDNDLNDIENNYTHRNGFFGVVVEGNNIVGTFGLFCINKEICELRKMYLLKEARGKGLGKYIVSLCIELAKERNYKKITLETIHVLKEAISLYKRSGFTEITPVEINDRVDQAFELVL